MTVIDNDSQFMQFSESIQEINKNSCGYIFKLNGNVHEEKDGIKKFETIFASLNQVGNMNVYKKQVLEYFLKNFDFCFLGFDCLDNLSLFPILKNTCTDMSFFWLNCAKKSEKVSTKEQLEAEIENEIGKRWGNLRTLCVNDILLKKKKFLKFSGDWIAIIQNSLCSNHNIDRYVYSISHAENKKSKEIISLSENIDEYKMYIIFGRLWEECLSRDRAILCFEKAAKISKGINKAKAKRNLARVYDILCGRSEAKKVIKEYKEAINLYKSNDCICEAIQCILELANFKRRALGNFNEALNDCIEVEKIINSDEFKKTIESQNKDEEYNLIQAQYTSYIGLIYLRLGDKYLSKCESLFEESLLYRKKIRDIRGEAESENAIGLIKKINHNDNIKGLNEATVHLYRALTINESIGNYIGAARNYRNLGLCYTDLIRLSKNEEAKKEYALQAKNSYEDGLNYWFMMKGDPPVEEVLEYKYRLGEFEINYGNNNKGIKLLLEVECEWKKAGNWHNRVRSLHLLFKGYSNNEFINSNGVEHLKLTCDKIINIYNCVLNSTEIINQIDTLKYANAIQILEEIKKIINTIGFIDRDVGALLNEILRKLKENKDSD